MNSENKNQKNKNQKSENQKFENPLHKSIEILVTPDFDGYTLLKFLRKKRVDAPFSLLHRLMRKKRIKVDGKNVNENFVLKKGQTVLIPAKAEKMKLPKIIYEFSQEDADRYLIKNIIYKDENVIAINKPAGISTQGGSKVGVSVDGLLDYLKFENEQRPQLVHRLDKDTTGVLLLARNRGAAQIITEGFKKKIIDKKYLALVAGKVEIPQGRIALPLGEVPDSNIKNKMVVDQQNGKIAVTEYKVVESYGNTATLLEVSPKTGRKHQIRVHLAAIGHPIIGDGKYGGSKAFVEGLSREMHLHAWKISHQDEYFKGTIQAPIPKHFSLVGG